MNVDFLVNIFFPPACICCAKKVPRGMLCEECRSGLTSERSPLRPVRNGNTVYLLGAAGHYENSILQALIHGLKFGFIKSAAEPLADVLCSYIKNLDINISEFIVVPLPLSKRRERIRGFNQSALIARKVAEHLCLPIEEAAIARVRHRKPQSETKSLEEREENIRGCFAASRVCSGKNILLIDDVTTSGATLLEAARSLTAAGAKKIIALAVARA